MQAKVKQEYFLPSLIAFSGVEFIKKEWRPVPVGAEAEAEAHPNLDVREDGDLEDEVNIIMPETADDAPLEVVDVEEPEPVKRPRARRQYNKADE